MRKYSAFMLWWKSVNDVLKSRNQPELLYGDARDFYQDYVRTL